VSTFARTTHRVARKAHRCAVCHTAIEAGTIHVDGACVYDGRWSRWRSHTECSSLDQQLQHIRAYDPEEPGQDVQILHINRNVGVEAMKRGDVSAIGINRTDLPGLSKRHPDVVFKVIARGRDLPNDVLLAGTHVSDAVVGQMKKVFSENSEALIAAVLLGPDENQKFQGMKFIPSIADADYNYVRKMYATIGQPQYAAFVGD
jgi:hypothetical protein